MGGFNFRAVPDDDETGRQDAPIETTSVGEPAGFAEHAERLLADNGTLVGETIAIVQTVAGTSLLS